jgi:lysozyme family protein
MSEAFDEALVFALRWEGGYVNHPSDPGGATNYGVTQGTYDRYRSTKGLTKQSVKLISSAEVHDIYESMYWDAARCAELPWPVSSAQFDAAVNAGPRQATQLLQRAAGVSDDGVIGPKSLAAINAMHPKELALRCCDERQKFYQSLVNRKPSLGAFLKGWTHRVNALRDLIVEAPLSFAEDEEQGPTMSVQGVLAEMEERFGEDL